MLVLQPSLEYLHPLHSSIMQTAILFVDRLGYNGSHGVLLQQRENAMEKDNIPLSKIVVCKLISFQQVS